MKEKSQPRPARRATSPGRKLAPTAMALLLICLACQAGAPEPMATTEAAQYQHRPGHVDTLETALPSGLMAAYFAAPFMSMALPTLGGPMSTPPEVILYPVFMLIQ